MSLPSRKYEKCLSQSDIARFWKKVIKNSDGCWEWAASHIGGYGTFSIKEKSVYAHRVAFIIQNGPIPDGLVVCHKCDNKGCVRGDHLFSGTFKQNTEDAISKRRMAYGLRNGAYTKPDMVRVGIRNGRSVLDDRKVKEIIDLWDGGLKNKYELARRYNVTDHAIRRIVKGEGWKHVKR